MVTQPNHHSEKIYGNSLVVRLKEKAKLFGDVDLLLQINKDKIEMDNLLKNICLSPCQSDAHSFKIEE
jgi:hypothetical protein